MAFVPIKIPYSQTGSYSKIVIDYLNTNKNLQPFFKFDVGEEGLKASIKARQSFSTPRIELSDALEKQYKAVETTGLVKQNIAALKKDTTFTVTTAHQPNIFTGPLYFLYKILHAIKLAELCKQKFPQYDFVPVYYMGSEDADLNELGHIYISGKKLTWNTPQTGAVGRMKVDKNLLQLLETVAGEVGVFDHGEEIISTIKKYYTSGITIQEATLKLVNGLFGRLGLVVVIPDNAALKALVQKIFSEELLNGHSSKIIEETGNNLTGAGYKVQAYSREINFFYLKDDRRERIEKIGDKWRVIDTDIIFSKEKLLQELKDHPERFSPNVILRGIFQESILPNIAFIGGGGELSYWLQTKSLFDFYSVPYPLLVLRNSFLIIDEKSNRLKNKLGFNNTDIFFTAQQLQNIWVEKNTTNNTGVANAIEEAARLYQHLSKQAAPIDSTLLQHIETLKKNTIKRIEIVGKKMLRAEKRNHDAAMRQIEKLKQKLFPNKNLQERIDNFIPYYAKYGSAFIDELYDHSLTLEQAFTVLEIA